MVTILEGIELTIGRSGAIIPNARLKVSCCYDIFSLKNDQDPSAIKEDLSNGFFLSFYFRSALEPKVEVYREV